jgi:hypothetical protein
LERNLSVAGVRNEEIILAKRSSNAKKKNTVNRLEIPKSIERNACFHPIWNQIQSQNSNVLEFGKVHS